MAKLELLLLLLPVMPREADRCKKGMVEGRNAVELNKCGELVAGGDGERADRPLSALGAGMAKKSEGRAEAEAEAEAAIRTGWGRIEKNDTKCVGGRRLPSAVLYWAIPSNVSEEKRCCRVFLYHLS